MDKISDEYETWPDEIINLKSYIPLNLQIRWTWMKTWINSKKSGNLHNMIELCPLIDKDTYN